MTAGQVELNKWSFGRCHETHLLEMRRIYVRHFSPAPCGRSNSPSWLRKNCWDIREGLPEQVDHRHYWLPAALPKYSGETQVREAGLDKVMDCNNGETPCPQEIVAH